ncbi:MAG: hypothetical protein JXM79_14565 [Sedimentisphaerales bacterium]|nr:hypothetical protein [Sedimentisphaerales bacterium]
MSNLDDNQIQDRLERLAKVEPTQEASDRAIGRVRDTLINDEAIPKLRLSLRDAYRRRLPPVFIVKLATAAVLLIGIAFLAGRFSAPKPVDVEALQANLENSLRSSLEATIRQELLGEMESRLQLALAAERNTLKQELHQQVAHDLDVFAEKTLTAVGNLTDRRFMEFARMVEAARIKDRQRVAAAFEYMGSRFGDGLVTLAAHTNELQRHEKNIEIETN